MKENKHYKAEITQVQQWAGPLPAPESLKKYNEAVPNAAERIIAMAEKEMEHRHKMEYHTLNKQSNIAMVSTILGFTCVLVLVGLVVYAIYAGAYGAALATVITAIATVAGIFGIGKLLRNKESQHDHRMVL